VPEANLGSYHVCKWFCHVEDVLATESGQLTDGDLFRKIVIAAAVHNPYAGRSSADPVRDSIGGGKAWVPSTGKVSGPGATIDIPLAHKDALYVRSHYDTVSASFGDAPRTDEVVIAFAFASRGRLHARLGGIAAEDIEGNDGLR
jgi:hypothetical protein